MPTPDERDAMMDREKFLRENFPQETPTVFNTTEISLADLTAMGIKIKAAEESRPENQLRQAANLLEEVRQAGIKDPEFNSEMDSAIDMLKHAKAEFELNRTSRPTPREELVQGLQGAFALTRKLDRLDQMKEPVVHEIEGKEPIIEGEIETENFDVENLVTLVENGFSNERSKDRTQSDIEPVDGLEMGDVDGTEIKNEIRQGKKDKLKHSAIEKPIDGSWIEERRLVREALMPEIRKKREEDLKKLDERAEEHRQKAEEWIRKIAARLGNKIDVHKDVTDMGEFMTVSGKDNADRLGLQDAKEGDMFSLRLVQVSEKDGIPKYGFKLVKN